jgi:hypothetical protein
MSKKKKNQGRADAEASAEASAEPRKKVSQTARKDEDRDAAGEVHAAGDNAAADAHAHAHDSAHGGHGGHEAVEAEDDKPKNGVITVFIAATCLVVIAMVIGVRELFIVVFDSEVNSKVLTVQASDLRALRATEQQRLTHYQWVSQKEGVVRIPVDRALELTLANYRNPPAAPMKEEPKPTEVTPKPEDTQSPGADDTKGGEGKDAAVKDGKTGDAKDAVQRDEKKGSAADPKKDAKKEKKPEDKPKEPQK